MTPFDQIDKFLTRKFTTFQSIELSYPSWYLIWNRTTIYFRNLKKFKQTAPGARPWINNRAFTDVEFKKYLKKESRRIIPDGEEEEEDDCWDNPGGIRIDCEAMAEDIETLRQSAMKTIQASFQVPQGLGEIRYEPPKQITYDPLTMTITSAPIISSAADADGDIVVHKYEPDEEDKLDKEEGEDCEDEDDE